MKNKATGTFEVKLASLPINHEELQTTFSRRSIDKEFFGDIKATSQGEMFAAGTSVKGSAGYVAIEKVSGELHGHKGTFILQHNGIMDRGAPQLTVTVVPDSGTEEFEGLTGNLSINIVDGKHFYEFNYELPETE